MITLTHSKEKQINRTFPNHELADICLICAGGGYTTAQTARAMIAQSEVFDTGKTKIKGFKIVMTTEEV